MYQQFPVDVLRFVDEDVHMEDTVQRQVGHQHAEADGQQQQRLKLVDNGQVQQHAATPIMTAYFQPPSAKKICAQPELAKISAMLVKIAPIVSSPFHHINGVVFWVTPASPQAPRREPVAVFFLNAVNAADGQVFTQRGNGCSMAATISPGMEPSAAGAAGAAGAAWRCSVRPVQRALQGRQVLGGGFGAVLFVLDGVKILLPQ